MAIDRNSFHKTALKYFDLWSCESVGEPFFTPSSLLWPATKSGADVMLKIADPDDDEAQAAEALQFFNGNGSVNLIQHDKHVFLMERITSQGFQNLERMVLEGQDDEATRVICSVVEKLHLASTGKPMPSSAIPLHKRSLSLRNYVEKEQIQAGHRTIFRFAYDILNELLAEPSEPEIFLHGDIHHFNILKSNDRGWLSIDPKGIQGPRIYDYANSLCNPYRHESVVINAARMNRQSSIISEFANLDKSLLLRFTFLHAMQAAAWSLFEPDLPYWLACARTAAKLTDLKVD